MAAMAFTPHDIDILARTLFGEARGESFLGKIAVAWVIRNRAETDLGGDGKADWWGEGIAGVCRARAQFSCWLAGDPNKAKLLAATPDDPVFLECLAAAYAVLTGVVADPTQGARHYYARSLRRPPAWAVGRSGLNIGGHIFLSDVA